VLKRSIHVFHVFDVTVDYTAAIRHAKSIGIRPAVNVSFNGLMNSLQKNDLADELFTKK
jgi:hypothetical protein